MIVGGKAFMSCLSCIIGYIAVCIFMFCFFGVVWIFYLLSI